MLVEAHSQEIKGVVLAGGKATRLYPLTLETSKHLLPIANKPLIVRVIEQLLAAEIRDILLLIDDRFASQFMQVLQDGSNLGVRSLSYVWQHPDGKGLPTAIAQVKNLVGDSKLLVACGDVLVENGIQQPIRDFMGQDKGARITASYLDDTAGYSPLEVTTDQVSRILPKDKTRHQPGLIDLGIYMYHADVFDHINRLIPSDRGETEIWSLNQIYIDNGGLTYTAIPGWWSDIGGGIETYLEAYKRYEEV